MVKRLDQDHRASEVAGLGQEHGGSDLKPGSSTLPGCLFPRPCFPHQEGEEMG